MTDDSTIPGAAGARSYMDVEGSVMATCGGCSGAVKIDKGRVVCNLPEPIDCVLPRYLDALRRSGQLSKGGSSAEKKRYDELLVVGSETWIAQHAMNTGPIPGDKPAGKPDPAPIA